MALRDLLKSVFGRGEGRVDGAPLPPADVGHDAVELARRLSMSVRDMVALQPQYDVFTIPKRRGGTRRITAPQPDLKELQRRINRKLLGRLKAHPAAMGFEKGQSIATHARRHAGRAVVVRMDIRDFFATTAEIRINAYFRRIGWNAQAAAVLTKLCTHQGALPQGAPTSPRLSNLVNYCLDARLAGLASHMNLTYHNPHTMEPVRQVQAAEHAIVYSRYADDMTFSFDRDEHYLIETVIHLTGMIVREYGYRLHTKKKLRIMRRHDRQIVTGLVVNVVADLPRSTRRWLRAVEHHLIAGRQATLTENQLAGWQALQHMILTQGPSVTDV